MRQGKPYQTLILWAGNLAQHPLVTDFFRLASVDSFPFASFF
jgi:hypothetical protein